MPLLFVYGSLKRGYQYAEYLREQSFVGEAILPGYQLLCCGDYPAIIKSEQEGRRVEGELYQVSEEALVAVDLLEGDEYERIGVRVEVEGKGEAALVYVASKALLRCRSYQPVSGDRWDGAIS